MCVCVCVCVCVLPLCSDCTQWQGAGVCQCSPNACSSDDSFFVPLTVFAVIAVLIFIGVVVCALKRRQRWIDARKSSAALLAQNHGQPAGYNYSHAAPQMVPQHQHATIGYHQQTHHQAPQTAVPVAVAVPTPQAQTQPQLDASVSVDPTSSTALQRSTSKRFDCVFSNKTNCDALCLDVRTKLESRHPPVSVWQQKTNIPKGACDDALRRVHRPTALC